MLFHIDNLKSSECNKLMDLKWVSYGFFALSAIIHIVFFIVESFLFQKKDGYKLFKLKPEEHAAVKIWALNQGFYNLFLAIGMAIGLFFVNEGRREAAGLLVSFCGLSMIGAGLVLFFSAPHLRRAAYIQMLPPIIGFLFLIFHVFQLARS
jgi:putative membrane protein